MSATVLNQALLKAAVEALPTDDLATVRHTAASRFADMAFPTIGEEDWKYTDLSTAADISNAWLQNIAGNIVAEPEVFGDRDTATVQEQIDAHWIVIRDAACNRCAGSGS